MRTCYRLWLGTSLLTLLFVTIQVSNAEEPAPNPAHRPIPRVMPEGQLPPDGRLTTVRTLNNYHPFVPPDARAWHDWFQRTRTRVLVSCGLWPLPEKTPLEPVVHGLIDKGDYTIEKVYFQSLPGHYVTGNLYRPKGPKGREGKFPAILSPHGHWQQGRMYDASDKGADEQIVQWAEQYHANARYPLQARMASLARLGCIVFHYDMVGYADSKALGHAAGFTDVPSILWLHSALGLQTYNSIRALDFLCSLEEVDTHRIGVTGASGGGTQTFLLCAVDDRPACAFPAVMVSTNMQGGCICENAPLLRVEGGNIELAALFAPRPLAMSGADDWTIDIESRGLPQLRELYAALRLPDNVWAVAYPQFKHNYNQVAREMMYTWMNRHLALGAESVAERPIDPVPPKQLSVFDDSHPAPADAAPPESLRQRMTEMVRQGYQSLWPSDAEQSANYRQIVGAALAAMVADRMPDQEDLLVRAVGSDHFPSQGDRPAFRVDRLLIGRRAIPELFPEEAVPTVTFIPDNASTAMVVWAHADGHAGLLDDQGQPGPELSRLLARRITVLAPDVFLTGEYHGAEPTNPPALDPKYAGYTLCYNRSLVAQRIHDLLTAIGVARQEYNASSVDLIGLGAAGPWVALARPLAGAAVRRAVVDMDGFSFAQVTEPTDPMLLPGGLRYGDLIGLTALAAPDPMYVVGVEKYSIDELNRLQRAFAAAGNPDGLKIDLDRNLSQAMDWLTQ